MSSLKENPKDSYESVSLEKKLISQIQTYPWYYDLTDFERQFNTDFRQVRFEVLASVYAYLTHQISGQTTVKDWRQDFQHLLENPEVVQILTQAQVSEIILGHQGQFYNNLCEIALISEESDQKGYLIPRMEAMARYMQ